MSASLQRHYKLRPSQYFTIAIFIAFLMSLVLLFTLPLGGITHTVLSLFILGACAFLLLKDARLSLASSCVAFRIEHNAAIALILRDGRHLTGMLMKEGVILPFVVLINVRLKQGGYRGLVLMRDSMDADSFRRLRVLLRWGVKQQDPVSLV